DPDSPADATTDASGAHLFASNGGRASVDAFGIASSGALGAIGGSPFASGVAGDFQSIALTPDQPPIASFKVRGGKKAHFDASASSDSDGGSVARYDWDFGDGHTLANGGPKPTHDYRNGDFTARLTVTDNLGCSSIYLSAGETAFCNGSGVATTTKEVDATPPKLVLKGKRTQKLGKPVTAKARCDERCGIRANGSIKIAGAGKFKLTQKSKELDAGRLRQLKLKLSEKARRAAEDAKKGKATVEVTATDDSTNKTKAKLKVKLR
ncbi:MAG: PKD domain-containing protein, partial [Solirubrobacterales bacterium]